MDALKDGSIALEELNKTCVLHYHCTSKVVCHIRNVSVFKIRRALQFEDYSSTSGFFYECSPIEDGLGVKWLAATAFL
jgi:hypothetical protein